MRRRLRSATAIFALVIIATSCSLLPQVPAMELEQIVRRDGVPFEAREIPVEIIDRLASHRVVLVGETHFLQEHRELLADLLRQLHAQGFRQFLFEWTQAADWLLADFVSDGGLEPGWTPPHDIGGAMITAIRDFNRTLPEEERIQVHAVDVTLPDYGGSQTFLASLGALSKHLPDPGPLSAFLQGDHGSPDSYEGQLEILQGELNAERSQLIDSWGEYLYSTVVELVEVELASVPVRAIREKNYDKSVRLREDAIKRLVDRRIESTPHGTLINIGSTHAQKERLRGTEIEWLGDYLVHESAIVDGSVIVLEVSAAHIESVAGSGIPDFDLTASPENELFRVMNEVWPDQMVFLPVDDPLFSSGRIPMNFSGDVYVGAPKQHYDAFILMPLAHRDFAGD